jgi:hypothetical protein
MSAQFIGPSSDEVIDGPTITLADGPQWDRAEVTLLSSTPGAGHTHGGAHFCQGYIVTDHTSQQLHDRRWQVRLGGKGFDRQRVYSKVISYADVQQVNDFKTPKFPGPGRSGSWPAASVFLNAMGFEQTIVGATQLGGTPGDAVGSPVVGSFPPIPPGLFDQIPVERAQLNFPAGWVLARQEADPLNDGAYSGSGPWILMVSYVYRIAVTYY